MIKCPYCKSPIEDNANFCPYCMKELSTKATVNGKPARKFSPWIIALAVLLAIIVVLILCIVFGSKGENENPHSSSNSGTTGSLSTPSQGDIVEMTLTPDSTISTPEVTEFAPEVTDKMSSATSNPTNETTASHAPDNTSNITATATPSVSATTKPTDSQSAATQTPKPTITVNPTISMATSTTAPSPSATTAPSPSATAAPTPSPVTTTTPNRTEAVYTYRASVANDAYGTTSAWENKITITGISTPSSDGIYIIPETIGGKKVFAIADYAFLNNTNIKKAVIPTSVTTIGECAFGNCTNLTDVYFCGESIYTESNSFAGCNSPTLNCSATCNNRAFYKYMNIADDFGLIYKEWDKVIDF